MILELGNEETAPPLISVVKLITSTWSDERGIYIKQTLRYVKRASSPENWVAYDVDNIGAADVVKSITNLSECADGVYQVIPCNEHRDWESGHIDDYEYKLIPFVK